MSAYDSYRAQNGAAGLAGNIGSVLISGFGAAPERSASASVVIATQIGRFVTTVFDTIAEWKEVRDTRKALSGLSDRELDDIGLTRGDIEAVARGH
ncbi:hypothetical protein GCM10011415_35270 [Salipiger pallidus]|uniref:YjiS-like domain-containing protein n=1 Tax=Salipiger pallidus TaxID=1775170 RepID=A0A8J3EHD1_9RHOB|nr:DUF1127 domain-containing protein [Salipiger pallidus]GGG82492.1 hypothetical protein GCM10011415_35270 [Salipiger pallidus]